MSGSWNSSVDNDNDNNDDDDNDGIERCNPRFYNLFTVLQTVSSTYAQVARVQSCANHVRHMKRLSHATWRVPCGTMGQLSC